MLDNGGVESLTEHCIRCGVTLGQTDSPASIVVTRQDTSSETLCIHCHNEDIAIALGITLSPLPFDLLTMMDSSGVEHRFTIDRQVVPKWIIVTAREITSGESSGYQIAVRGAHKTDIDTIFHKLIKKVERELNASYISEDTYQGYRLPSIRGDVVKGRFTYDPHSQGTPLVVIGGKSYDWDAFGRILGQFEGFQFKITMSDLTDD